MAESKSKKTATALEAEEKKPKKTAAALKSEAKPEAKSESKPKAAKKPIAGKSSGAKAKNTAKKAEPAGPKRYGRPPADGKPRVLLVAAEVNPFSQTGGLGEVASSLPVAVNAIGGAEVAVVTPLYECVKDEYRKNFEFVCHISVPVAWRNQYAGLFRYVYRGVVHYFIDNEYYFKRPNLYGYYDDAERFAFFSRAVLDLMPYMDFQPNILHSNDWHTALVPIYYKLYYMYADGYKDIRNLITIHNIEYQGKYDGHLLEEVFGISGFKYYTLEWGGCVNLLYGAIAYGDMVSTVSRTYAQELRTSEHACGLENAIDRYAGKLTGIVNGIDTEVYDPSAAPALFAHYSADDTSGKLENKRSLQKLLGLPERDDVPMITMVTRLAGHKGLDILKAAMPRIIKEDVQFVLLGTGECEYEGFFADLQATYPDKARALITFDKVMSQRLFAAGDIYMMPSKSEPCGLGQMMAMRYGTIPIVRNVGGLNDTVVEGENGNGFVVKEHTAEALTAATLRAIGMYADKNAWKSLMRRAMTEDWSWNRSGREYIGLYKELLAKPIY